MPKARYTTEDIIHKLREADVLIGQGKTVAEACTGRYRLSAPEARLLTLAQNNYTEQTMVA